MSAPARTSYVRHIMGMPISVHVRGALPAGAGGVVEEVFAELEEVDRVFSTYRPDSEISRLRSGELSDSDCSADVLEVLGLCEDARERTGGYFDALLPDDTGQRRLDPSGLVKGWAAERAAARLAAGERDYYLDAGGDIAVRCAAPLAPWWRIGIEDPRNVSAILGVLPVHTGGVATSGTARRGSHILDPRTGTAPAGVLSVTVTGPSLMWADVYATAAFARGAGALDWLTTLDGYDALVVRVDGGVDLTPGMRDRFRPA